MSEDAPSPLAELPGTWSGDGLIVTFEACPEAGVIPTPHVRRTHEAIAFAAIGADGDTEPCAARCSGGRLEYVHERSDAQSGEALGVQTGLWVTVRRSNDAGADMGIARLTTPSAGRALLATGAAVTIEGPPEIPAASFAPVDLASGLLLADRGRSSSGGLSGEAADDPNSLLRGGIRCQGVIRTTVLTIEASAGVGQELRELPYAVRNPDSLDVYETVWIEWIADSARGGERFVQLQYSQTAVLAVGGIGWPTVSLATLTRR